jgi:ATP-dependent RNA helicase RhlE
MPQRQEQLRPHISKVSTCREGGREGGRKGGREGGREGEREREREREKLQMARVFKLSKTKILLLGPQ